jgi:hypothetical protein
MNQRIRRNPLFSRPGNLWESIENPLKGHAQLHFGDARPEALMHAMTEGDMFFDIIARQIKSIGVRKNIWISISGTVPEHDFFVFRNPLTV